VVVELRVVVTAVVVTVFVALELVMLVETVDCVVVKVVD